MGGKSGSSFQVNDYLMSLFYGICGEGCDKFLGLYIGEKEVWAGELELDAPQKITINKPDLFGGYQREGGVKGDVYIFPGKGDQKLPAVLATKFGREPDTCPAYRGLTTVLFTGSSGASVSSDSTLIFNGERAGFTWGSNNPYLQSIWTKWRRKPKGFREDISEITRSIICTVVGSKVTVNADSVTLLSGTAQVGNTMVKIVLNDSGTSVLSGSYGNAITGTSIWINEVQVVNCGEIIDSSTTTAIDGGWQSTILSSIDANPACIIYECMTNASWGMGCPVSLIDTSSFNAAAETLYSESFGLSTYWNRQKQMSEFINDILDHIQATLFVNPRTGLWTLKLMRDDYDISALPELNPTNCKVTKFDRKTWGEAANEIVVHWTNPDNEQSESVTYQNLASIMIQGATISDSRDYHMARNADLAMQLASRDCRASSYPLATFEIEVDRSAWDITPGSVRPITYPEEGISRLPIRILNTDYGKAGKMAITLSAVEDIFSLPAGSYTIPTGSKTKSTSVSPSKMDTSHVVTAPYYFLVNAVDRANLSTYEYPEALVACLASSANPETLPTYDVVAPRTLSTGATISKVIGSKVVCGYGSLQDALAQEANSVISSFGTITGGSGISLPCFLIIGNSTEEYQEIAQITGSDTDGYHVTRGILDTTPYSWPAGTRIWVVSSAANVIDTNTIYASGQTALYKFLTYTSAGRLAFSDSPIIGCAISARPWSPLRPANVKINGTAFGIVDVSVAPPTSLSVTWSNRNRLMEDSSILGWTDATVTPESGQATTITIRDDTGAIVTTIDGLTGTSYDLPLTAFGTHAICDVTLTSKRDGLASIQGHTIRVKVATSTVTPSAPGAGTENGGYTVPTGTTMPAFQE